MVAVTVETGSASATADGYISAANAQAYLEKHGVTDFVDAAASGQLTLSVQPTDGDTITIDEKTYTFQASLTNADGNVAIGANVAATQLNLLNAINLTGTPGTGYAASTVVHPSVTASAWASNVSTITAKVTGGAGNSIATTSSFTSGSNSFAAATLSGGTFLRDAAIIRAARWMEANFSWRGMKQTQEQALGWPRYNAFDNDGYDIPISSVPAAVANANALAAYIEFKGTQLDGYVTQPDTVVKDKLTVGPITIEKEFQGGQSLQGQVFMPLIYKILSFVSTGGTGRLIRG